jgi:probable phosphoglycerate mutase
MTTTLIIARHGNTFGPEDTPRRVGGRTDLPLVEKGLAQGRAIGRYLKENALIPDVVYAASLLRTQQTAREAIRASGITNPIYTLDIFNEIDYGPDENKTEAEVLARIGAQALEDWDKHAKIPEGWAADPDEIIRNWLDFGAQIRAQGEDETVLVVTSNGIARFAPHLTGDFAHFAAHFPLKLATGALGILRYEGKRWRVEDWNIKP